MTSPRHTARAIVIHHGKLLLMERWRNGKHYFSVPGGGIEEGELPEQTVVREILEETNCVVTVERPLYLLRVGEANNTIFLCQYVSGEPILPSNSPEAIQATDDNRFKPGWVDLADLATTYFRIWEPVRRQLLHDLAHSFSDKIIEIPNDSAV